MPDHVRVGGVSQMAITLQNDNASAISGVAFTDDFSLLPMRLVDVADHLVVSNTCGGTLAVAPGGTSAGLVGGSIAPNDTCSVVLNVTGTAIGSAQNHTGAVLSANASAGPDAAATLFIDGGALVS